MLGMFDRNNFYIFTTKATASLRSLCKFRSSNINQYFFLLTHPTEMALMRFMGKAIPDHPVRKERLAKEALEREQKAKDEADAAKQAAKANTSASTAGSSKKKGKKGKKK